MAEYNLFDHQKDLLRTMVAAYRRGCGPDFMSMSNSMFTGIVLIAKNGLREQIECDTSDLAALDKEGLIQLTTFNSGAISPRALRVVDDNFASSENSSWAKPSIGNLTQNIYGQ